MKDLKRNMSTFIKIIVKELLKEELNQYICNVEKSLYLYDTHSRRLVFFTKK